MDGAVPSSRSQGPITETGNPHARRPLVEAAWHHRKQRLRPIQLGAVVGDLQRHVLETLRTEPYVVAALQITPPLHAILWRSSSLLIRRASSRARSRSRAASSAVEGTRIAVNPSSRSGLPRCSASRASVLTRSPAGCCSFKTRCHPALKEPAPHCLLGLLGQGHPRTPAQTRHQSRDDPEEGGPGGSP